MYYFRCIHMVGEKNGQRRNNNQHHAPPPWNFYSVPKSWDNRNENYIYAIWEEAQQPLFHDFCSTRLNSGRAVHPLHSDGQYVCMTQKKGKLFQIGYLII